MARNVYPEVGFWSATVFAFLALLLLLKQTFAGGSAEEPLVAPPKPITRPNVVFILTDDQDAQMDSIDYMPLLQRHMINEGTLYQRHYCTIALCCPSRASLLTGKAAHNTNVTDVNPPHGGYTKFVSQGLNEAYLPVWVQNAGYRTYYTGKLLNGHTIDNYNDPYPAGFTGTDFLLDPFTYDYLGPSFQRNNTPPIRHEGEYSTDLIASKSFGFLEDAIESKDPFFLTIAPIACHSNVRVTVDDSGWDFHTGAPIPAERHKDMFNNVSIPRNANFNPEKPSGVSWISKLPLQSDENVAYNDDYYRNRLRALQAVDEIVDGVIQRLRDNDLLDSTYIIYTTDNGFHLSQHRLQAGKGCGFEEDINIPLIIRGPGVPKGQVTDIMTSHTDLAPTILGMIGEAPRPEFDGLAIPLTQAGLAKAKQTRHEHVNVEYWGYAYIESQFDPQTIWNNTYKALRIVGDDYNLYYSVWCNNEHELYEMKDDPHQVKNLHPDASGRSATAPDTLKFGQASYALDQVISRLDALLMVLKSCKAESCIEPWSVLHPEGDVLNLHDALQPLFDSFYQKEQTRIRFDRCEQFYLKDAEGPQDALAFESLITRGRSKLPWTEFV